MLKPEHAHSKQLDDGYQDPSWIGVVQLTEDAVQLHMYLGTPSGARLEGLSESLNSAGEPKLRSLNPSQMVEARCRQGSWHLPWSF